MVSRRVNRFRRRRPFRRVVRKQRRRYRKTFRRSSNRTNGNFTCQVRTQVDLIASAGTGVETTHIVRPTLSTFGELAELIDNFEAYRIHYVRVKVVPYANTSTPDDPIGEYVSAPYHKPVTTTSNITAANLLSIDRSRVFQGNSTSTRTFVPAIRTATQVGDSVVLSNTVFRPRIEISSDSIKIPHYCGLYAFPPSSNSTMGAPLPRYSIVTTAKVTLYNQKTFLLK